MDIQTNTSPKSLTNRRRLKLTLTVGLINIAVIAGVSIHIWRLSHAATTYVVPTSINSNCNRDVTADLNSWIASVPNGNNITFRSGACYEINNRVIISGRSNLAFDGAGATFRAMTSGRELSTNVRNRSQFYLYNSSGLTFKNMVVYGANPNAGTGDAAYVAELEAQHAFDIASSSNVTLDGVQAYDTYGDFVYLGQQGGAQPANITIKNSRFERNGRQGVGIASGKGVIIENNTFANTRRSTFDLEPNTTAWNIENITIRNNRIGSGRLLFIANGGACATVRNIVVEDNTLNRAMNSTIAPNATCPVKRGPYKFIGNIATSAYGTNAKAAMQISQVSDLVVSNNTQPMQAGREMNLVSTSSSSNVKVTGNTLLAAVGSILFTADTTAVCHSSNYIGNPPRAEATNIPCLNPPVTPPPPPNPGPSPIPTPPPSSTSSSNSNESPTSGSLSLGQTGNNASGGSTDSTATTNSQLLDEIRKQTWVRQSFLQKVAAAFLIIPEVSTALLRNPTSLYAILSDEQKRTSLMIAGGLLIGLGSIVFALYDVLRRKQKVKKLDKSLSPAPIKPAKAAPEVDSDQDNTLPPPSDTSN